MKKLIVQGEAGEGERKLILDANVLTLVKYYVLINRFNKYTGKNAQLNK